MKRLCFVIYLSIIGLPFLFSNQALANEPTINQQYTLEKKQRVSRTEYDFSYRVNITNHENAIKNVTATVFVNSYLPPRKYTMISPIIFFVRFLTSI